MHCMRLCASVYLRLLPQLYLLNYCAMFAFICVCMYSLSFSFTRMSILELESGDISGMCGHLCGSSSICQEYQISAGPLRHCSVANNDRCHRDGNTLCKIHSECLLLYCLVLVHRRSSEPQVMEWREVSDPLLSRCFFFFQHADFLKVLFWDFVCSTST